MILPLSHLHPSPINDSIYSPTDLSELKQSILNFGLLEPIVVSKETKNILSGHRRYYSLKQLGIKEVEVREVSTENETIQIIQHNQHRQKTTSDILNECRFMEQELKKQFGGQTKGSRNDLNGKGRFVVVQEIANKLGVGFSQLKMIRTINNYMPELIQKIDDGELSVGGAYKIVKEKHLSHQKRSVPSDFEKSFKKLLTDHEPTKEQILHVLKNTNPYSLENFDGETLVKNNQSDYSSDSVKKKVSNY